MRAIVFFVQLLLWLLIIRLLLRGLARLFAHPEGKPAAAQRAQSEDLVLDPVCRTHIPRSRAVFARIAGREEAFCSPECRDKAKSAVAKAS